MITEKCGTYAGYNSHRHRDETPCEACQAAATAYMAEWRARPDTDWRRRDNARKRALSALARQFPDEYRACYVSELLNHSGRST